MPQSVTAPAVSLFLIETFSAVDEAFVVQGGMEGACVNAIAAEAVNPTPAFFFSGRVRVQNDWRGAWNPL
jgi:hypothetical protein